MRLLSRIIPVFAHIFAIEIYGTFWSRLLSFVLISKNWLGSRWTETSIFKPCSMCSSCLKLGKWCDFSSWSCQEGPFRICFCYLEQKIHRSRITFAISWGCSCFHGPLATPWGSRRHDAEAPTMVIIQRGATGALSLPLMSHIHASMWIFHKYVTWWLSRPAFEERIGFKNIPLDSRANIPISSTHPQGFPMTLMKKVWSLTPMGKMLRLIHWIHEEYPNNDLILPSVLPFSLTESGQPQSDGWSPPRSNLIAYKDCLEECKELCHTMQHMTNKLLHPWCLCWKAWRIGLDNNRAPSMLYSWKHQIKGMLLLGR